MSVKVSKITVEIGDSKIELTPQDAQKLYSLLEEYFGSKKVEIIRESPIIIGSRPYFDWDHPDRIWYNHDSSVKMYYDQNNIVRNSGGEQVYLD